MRYLLRLLLLGLLKLAPLEFSLALLEQQRHRAVPDVTHKTLRCPATGDLALALGARHTMSATTTPTNEIATEVSSGVMAAAIACPLAMESSDEL